MLTFNFKFNKLTEYLLMEKVSLLEFRRHALGVIRKVRQGQPLIMTYRGQPVMRLEPIRANTPNADDPFYLIAQLATATGQTLTNEEIDQIVYPD
jgi:prevent-host-death family protein